MVVWCVDLESSHPNLYYSFLRRRRHGGNKINNNLNNLLHPSRRTIMTMTLLDHVRALVEAERDLTEALEQTLPLLSSNSSSSVIPPSSSSKRGAEPPLLPSPRSSAEVPTILAVARAYSLRTSAPPAWNTNLPVVGFATPNPLPHQLRGGALGAMQLSLAREEKKRKRKEVLVEEQRRREQRLKLLEESEKLKNEISLVVEGKGGVDNNRSVDNAVHDDGYIGGENQLQVKNNGITPEAKTNDPKRQEMIERQRVQMVQQQQQLATSTGQQLEESHKKKMVMSSMNLSESSSSSSSGEEGSDDE